MMTHETFLFLRDIQKSICTLKNSGVLFMVPSVCSARGKDAIEIPELLLIEFKQKLMEYYRAKYNEYIKKLNTIEL